MKGKTTKVKYFLLLCLIIGLTSCTSNHITSSSIMPPPDPQNSVTLFLLDNYTTSHQAGARAANLIEGILIERGYQVVTEFKKHDSDIAQQLKIAKKNGSRFLLNGGVTEWRYKTGIDGEPAVSLQLKLIDVITQKVVWNSVASSNNWGNGTVGKTAQLMLEEMLRKGPKG